MPKKKMTKAREFNQKSRQYIKERDGNNCIFCQIGYHMKNATPAGLYMKSIMHYIPRSRNGLGIPENGAVGCQYHHEMLDNGYEGHREEMMELFKAYLIRKHPGWSEDQLVYKKWDF